MSFKALWRVLCLLCVLSVAVAAWAQPAAPTLLRFNFLPGHVDALNLDITGSGEIAASGGPAGEEFELPLRFHIHAPMDLVTESVDAAGNGRLSMRMSELGMQVFVMEQEFHLAMNLAKGTVTVDGRTHALPGLDMAQALESLSVVISPQGKVLDVQGLEQLVKMMKLAGPAAAMLSGTNRQQLLQMMQSRAPVLPEQPVSPGDTWEQHVMIPFPPTAPTKVSFTYTLEQVGEVAGQPVARVGLSGMLELKEVPLLGGQASSGLPGLPAAIPPGFKSTLDLLSLGMSGDLYYPLAGGYLHSANLALDLTLDTSTELPEGLGGGALRVSATNLTIYENLTPRK